MADQLSRSDYYSKVGAYYDDDVPHFHDIYCANTTLQKLRESFRLETEQYPFETALEIGFGLGLDLIHYAQKYPEKSFYGVDVSPGMCERAKEQVDKLRLHNVTPALGSVENIEALFPGKQFDLIYIYFGALNTVEDLSVAAKYLKNVLAPGGKIVLTTINKWYLSGILLPLIKGRTKIAFQRLKPVWGGYSPKRYIESKCYTPAYVRAAFSDFKVIKKRGYSIVFPAWYQDNLRTKLGSLYEGLWKADKLLNHTPLWDKGEYTLFILEHR